MIGGTEIGPVLVDANLIGLMIGCTLSTKPKEIYHALIFGTRKIIDTFQDNGVRVVELYGCGGLPQRKQCDEEMESIERKQINIPKWKAGQ